MARMTLSARTIPDLDNGMAEAMINHAIAIMIRDLEDRGAEDGKSRAVNIQVEGKIVKGVPMLQVHADTKLPAMSGRATATDFRRRPDGLEMFFSAMDPENPHQTTIDEHIAKAEGE